MNSPPRMMSQRSGYARVAQLLSALMLMAPTLASFALRFGPPEYTSLLLMGLFVLAYMSGGSMLKTLAMAVLGLLLGMIGIDVMSGYTRFSFDIVELGDGVGIVPVAVGLFGISEILLTAGQADPPKVQQPTLRQLVPTKADLKLSVGPIMRGSFLGFMIGIIPGSAHIISSFVSYGIERRMSKHPERFGNGAIEGAEVSAYEHAMRGLDLALERLTLSSAMDRQHPEIAQDWQGSRRARARLQLGLLLDRLLRLRLRHGFLHRLDGRRGLLLGKRRCCLLRCCLLRCCLLRRGLLRRGGGNGDQCRQSYARDGDRGCADDESPFLAHGHVRPLLL